MSHECSKEEFLGQVKEFMHSFNGMKTTMLTLSFAIVLQVGTFLFLWGGLSTTVKYHDEMINKILAKLEVVKVIGYAVAGEKGERGIQGEKGEPGQDLR